MNSKLTNLLWHRLDGSPLKVYLFDTLLSDISKTNSNLSFYIGADSQYAYNKVIYSVVLVMLKKGRGGRGYYNRIITQGKITTKQRLFQETYFAVKLATEINPLLETIGHAIKEIHTDLNPDPNYISSTMISQCLGYINGMGFVGRTKPDSWAASSVADLKSR